MNKDGHVPGINPNTRTFGVLRGLEDDRMGHPLPQPSPPQLLHPPAGYHGKQMAITRNRLSPELRSDLESIEEEDEDEDDEPIVNSCCLCCNLGAGLLLGAIAFMIFDTIFLAQKAKKLFTTSVGQTVGVSHLNFQEFPPETDESSKAGTALQIISIIFSAFAVLASFMLILSVCLCGVPEKKNTLKFVSRYWMLQIGLNALFQSIENLYNTLPDSESVFVLELPGIGIPEVLGGVAVAITWVFSVGYLLGYFFMVVLILSHATVLRNMARERVKTFYEKNQPIKNRQMKRPFDSDLHSQLTFTERLSDTSTMSPSPAIENYTEVSGMSDMNMDDLYSMRKVAPPTQIMPTGPLPSIPEQMGTIPNCPGSEMGNSQMANPQMDSLLQAQLAMLHPIQKFQFLQQQIKNHQMAHLQRNPSQMKPKKIVTIQEKNNFQNSDCNSNIFQDEENLSEVSTRSKPNSNGHNVRFLDIEQKKG